MATKEKLLEWADYLETPGLDIGTEFFFSDDAHSIPCCGIGHILEHIGYPYEKINASRSKRGWNIAYKAADVMGLTDDQIQEITNLNNRTPKEDRGRVLAAHLRKLAEE